MAAHAASAIVEQLHGAGLNLSLAPAGRLAVAPSNHLTADLRDLIRSSKTLLIDWLTAAGQRRLPERQAEHPAHRTHGARPGAGYGDADSAERRYTDLQAVCRERFVQTVCGGHGVCADEPAAATGCAVARGVGYRFSNEFMRQDGQTYGRNIQTDS